jgi:hypothetical protein
MIGTIKKEIKNGIMIILPQFDNGVRSTETAYSDRLYRENPKKHDELCQKYFGNQGQYWANRKPEKIQDFLSEFIGKSIFLCRVEDLENQSSGYPYWRFDFKYNP